MDIQRTIPIILDENPLVLATVLEFNRYQRCISPACFNNGTPLRAVLLQQEVYRQVKSTLGSQMKCSAIRRTAATYAALKSNGKPAKQPVQFRKPSALFLAGKDFSFKKDGTLSIGTLQGRQRIGWRIPKHFQFDFDFSKSIDSLTVTKNSAHLCITLEVPEPAGVVPVGIDLGVNNALVASTATDTLFVSGKDLSIRNTKLRKVKNRLKSRHSGKKAQHSDTRSVRRVLQRLFRKHHNSNLTFCRETAAQLCKWAPPNAVLVFEDLRITPKTKKIRMRKGTRRKLNQWFFRTLITAVQHRAERQGIALDYVNPAFTSQIHHVCGLMGVRKGHLFHCPSCAVAEHSDINAAQNIRLRFTVLRSSGPKSAGPEALASA
jgi:putative transposase